LPGYHVFLTNVLPYLVHGQAESFRWANVTLVGAGGAIGLGRALTDGARVLVALAAGAAILWRLRQEVDERLKIVEVAGLVVLVTLLDASFGWYAYGIWLIPLLVSAVHPSALVRTWTAWLGVYLFASPTSSTTPFVGADPGVKQLDFTAGYLVLLLVLGAVAFRSGALFRSHRGVPRDAILVWPWRR